MARRPIRFVRTKALLLLVVTVFGIWSLVFKGLPSLVNDWTYRDQFVPATGIVITSAKCETWDGFLFHDCTVNYRAGTEAELSFGAPGAAPDGPIHLLRLADRPDVFTIDAALSELTGRTIFAVVLTALFGFLAYTCVRMLFRPTNMPKI